MDESRQDQIKKVENAVNDRPLDILLSHELRTPLTSIMGYAELMLNDPLLGEEARKKFVQIIINEGERLSRVIAHLCDEAKKQQSSPPQEDQMQ